MIARGRSSAGENALKVIVESLSSYAGADAPGRVWDPISPRGGVRRGDNCMIK